MVDVSEYKQETSTSDSFLDPHHTHFILVDDDETGSEIDFRSKFESRQLYSGCICFAHHDANYIPQLKKTEIVLAVIIDENQFLEVYRKEYKYRVS